MMDNSVSSNGLPGSFAGSVPVVTNSTPPPAAEAVPRSSPRQRLLAALPGLLPRNLRASNLPSGGATSPTALYKRAIRALSVTAFLALLAASLLLPGGPLYAQEAAIQYPEKGTGPVATYTAVDPEGTAVRWSLGGANAGAFSITGGVLRFKSTPDYEAPADAGTDNTYNITVVATDSDGGAAELTVTVNVMNVDEAGTLTLSTLQPVDGIPLATTLTDIDGTPSATTWKWAKASTARGVYTDIEGATAAAYMPKPADVDHYLRATATYTDPQGSGKTAVATTANKVLGTRSTNTPPVFKDADGMEIADNETITREVAENTPKGEPVGALVAATDSEGDVLTYTLGGTNASLFSIDVATGQLRTSAALDREVSGGDSYMVMVTATDPSFTDAADSDMIEVTINVTNVNEDPKLTGPASARVAENTTISTPIATTAYEATDDEDDADVVLTLSGTDAAAFSLVAGEVTFKALPNFEAPKDAGRNNVYNITVVATDSDGQTDEMGVIVTVTNVDEAGTVTLSLLQPRIGTALTATLSDIDGAVSDVKWQWAKDASAEGTFEDMDIEGATAASYTPVMADDTMFLRATARYTDPEGSGKMAMSDPTEDGFSGVEIDDTNRAPEFPDLDDKMDGDQTDQEREIAENTDAGEMIGAVVTATDPNDDDLTYSLGGTDGASFSIVRTTGQLETKAALDREVQDTHMVTVTATDPSGLSATVNVTIKITNVDEDPTLTGPASPRVAENTPSATAVATYIAMDDEDDKAGTAIRWSLGGTNAGDFSITGGVLRFKSAPNYEPAAGSTYSIMVIATDSDDDTDDLAVTVTVMNVDEAGTLTLSTLQPVDGIEVTTTLTDIDGAVSATTWKWAKASTARGAYTDIEGATAAAYMPKPADVDHYLRATATYTDPQGSSKIAVATTANKVLGGRSANTAPVFEDADDMEIATGTAITREVVENTSKGEPVGAPVAATDSEGDVLTYTLGGNGEGGNDEDSFSIDVATGQLRTSAALNEETKDTYTVTVTATDPYVGGAPTGYSDEITVTINVTNVNEDPKLTGPASARVAENTTISTPIATTAYEATDDEDDADVVLTLSGTDAAAFSLVAGEVTFKALPNFEAPKDAGRNNVYNITVVATDSDGQTDEMDVIVTVTNVEEDGTVTLSPLQPRIGSPVTATLSDVDGAVSDVKWQWAKSTSVSGTYDDIDGATASSYTPVATDDPATTDNGMFLRGRKAIAENYTDPEGSGETGRVTDPNGAGTHYLHGGD